METRALQALFLITALLTAGWIAICLSVKFLIVWLIGDSPVITWSFALALSFGFLIILKANVTQYKTSLAQEVIKHFFISICKTENIANGDEHVFPLRSSAFKFEPSKSRAMRSMWMHKSPKFVISNGVLFNVSLSFSRMVESARYVEDGEIEKLLKSSQSGDVFNLTGIEFVFNNASTADVYGLGYHAAKFIMESKMNHGTPIENWAFGYDTNYGVCLRFLELPVPTKLVA